MNDSLWIPEQHDQRCPARQGGVCVNEAGCKATPDGRNVESKWAALVARGCTCGDANYTPCSIHTDPGDNRGIRAWFEAGMPEGFPVPATCAVCGADGLLYPNVDLENPAKPSEHTPTLICSRCSTPYLEVRLRAKCEANGYAGRLNDKRVFGLAAVV